MNTTGLIVSIVVIAAALLLIFMTKGKTSEDRINLERSRVISTNIKDDLTKVEGIGPKIQTLLETVGINTYGDLAQADVEKLRKIMETNNLRIADPTTWPKQGQLLAEGKLDELRQFQETLKGGRL